MSKRRLPNNGLYAIANGPRSDLVETATAAMQGGARMLQYRDLTSNAAHRLEVAIALVAAGARHDVPIIIDHDLELMRASGAAGVHLGAMDADPASVRERIGPDAIIGVSCYGDPERARVMSGKDVDYLSFGAFHPSPSKPNAQQVPADLLREVAALGPAVVAIGGITPDNGAPLIAAGADFLASISGVFDAPDARAAAQRFSNLFDATRAASS